MTKKEQMKQAIEAHKKGKKPDKEAGKPVAAAATGPRVLFVKKDNPRSAAARDARAKARGRLPAGYQVEARYMGEGQWAIKSFVHDKSGNLLTSTLIWADGLFRGLEQADIDFWEWFLRFPALHDSLDFDKEDHKPEPYPKGETDVKA